MHIAYAVVFTGSVPWNADEPILISDFNPYEKLSQTL